MLHRKNEKKNAEKTKNNEKEMNKKKSKTKLYENYNRKRY